MNKMEECNTADRKNNSFSRVHFRVRKKEEGEQNL